MSEGNVGTKASKHDPEYYGVSLALYKGRGVLILAKDENVDCEFQLFQLSSGKIILLVETTRLSPLDLAQVRVKELRGQTAEGHKLRASGFFAAGLAQTFASSIITKLRFLITEVHVEFAQALSWRFKIVNAELPPGRRRIGINHPKGKVTLGLVDDYSDVMERLKLRIHGIAVTALLDVETRAQADAAEVADDICYLLSLACGTKVRWISYQGYTDSGVIALSTHRNNVTKPYAPMNLLDPKHVNDTEQFLQTTLDTYVQRKTPWELSDGLINAYMEAKRDLDFLESRALKLVAVIEMFKRIFIQVTRYEEFTVSNELFAEMIPGLKEALKPVLTQHGFEEPQRAAIYSNLRALNRKPFDYALEALNKYLGLDETVSATDRKLFVKCRNSLVHDGRFYCQSANDEDRKNVRPRQSPMHEYLWLLHAVDRMFLRLVSYDGPYIDWQEPDNPTRREKVLASS